MAHCLGTKGSNSLNLKLQFLTVVYKISTMQHMLYYDFKYRHGVSNERYCHKVIRL